MNNSLKIRWWHLHFTGDSISALFSLQGFSVIEVNSKLHQNILPTGLKAFNQSFIACVQYSIWDFYFF